jgi:hypothetical protein
MKRLERLHAHQALDIQALKQALRGRDEQLQDADARVARLEEMVQKWVARAAGCRAAPRGAVLPVRACAAGLLARWRCAQSGRARIRQRRWQRM